MKSGNKVEIKSKSRYIKNDMKSESYIKRQMKSESYKIISDGKGK